MQRTLLFNRTWMAISKNRKTKTKKATYCATLRSANRLAPVEAAPQQVQGVLTVVLAHAAVQLGNLETVLERAVFYKVLLGNLLCRIVSGQALENMKSIRAY
jgi:hypothetical protein